MARSDLPSGTVTFLFTDVEGSTRLLHSLGAEAYAEALAEHRRLIREACAREGGVEVDTQGDAFFFAFGSAPGALAAASAFTDALAASAIRVRCALHTGTPLLAEEGYVGHDVHLAARVASAGHGGQVLVSATTASLLETPLSSLGSHRLKDVSEPLTLYQLGEGSFPPLKTIANSNLPTPVSSFLGREDELYQADELLHSTRLLTISGPGGQGKTRFALELARRAREERFSDYSDGVFSSFFASLRDPSLVLATIAQTLSVQEQPGRSALDTLSSHLEAKKLLLLCDNLEHLLEAAPELSQLLERAPGLTLLVTSREVLRIQGEQSYALPPLPEDEGVALFCERAKVEPSPEIAELASRLEGLPLAIELAAARLSVLTPTQLLERLASRLDLLKGTRDADPRQQTLRATIEWSYDLLSEDEQALVRSLSVFHGGCTLEAAEEVCGADLDLLQSLVDKSLLRFSDSRFWMLETIREYAAERLGASGEGEAVRERHADWYATRSATLLWPARMDEPGAREAFERDLPNIRAALDEALRREDVGAAGDCLYGLWYSWLLHGMGESGPRAAMAWLALDHGCLDPLDRVPGLIACGEILRFAGDLETAAHVKREEIDIARAHPDGVIHGRSLQGDLPFSLSDLALVELGLGDHEAARRYSDEAIDLWTRLGDRFGLGHALNGAIDVALVSDDPGRGRSFALRAIECLSGADAPAEDLVLARLGLAECELQLRHLDEAASELGLGVAATRGSVSGVITAANARVAALLSAACGGHATAARLASAFRALLEEAGIALSNDPYWTQADAELREELRQALDHETLARETAVGATLEREPLLDLCDAVAGCVLRGEAIDGA